MPRLLSGCLAAALVSTLSPLAQADRPDDWPLASPESRGLSSQALDQAARDIQQVPLRYCFTVIKNGELVYDRNYYGGANKSFTAFSVTKTMASTLMGIAQSQGYLSLDDRISDWLDELPRGMNPEATIRHVLGQVSESDPAGQSFSYNSGSVIDTLGEVVTRATGMASVDYAQRELLDPLGMQYTSWSSDWDGNFKAGAGAKSSCRDIARVGQLLLDGGEWHGQRLLPESYIHDMTHPSYPEANANYGYLTWLNKSEGEWHRPFKSGTDVMLKGAPRNAYFATGFLGQFIIVLPDENMVVTTMGMTLNLESLNTLQDIWDALSPVLESAAP